MARNERTLREYALPNLDMVQGSIMRPVITANNFEIKPAIIQLIQNAVLRNSERGSELTFKMVPPTLLASTRIYHDMGRTCRKIPTKVLLHQQNGLAKKGNFDVQAVRRRKHSRNIEAFQDADSEVPTPQKPEWLRLQTFYSELDVHSRSGLDGAVARALMNKTNEDAYEVIESMAMNSCQWPTKRHTYGQRPYTVKVVEEDNIYQQLHDKIN
ncbi:retrotransposon gag protein [Gossypium australe]|uniref:Retrotransposon gag protein n=1 Tax=Gossypium australe TaxID=47621 RepID=A0A5B6VUT4_9ROSI|nr:retrotransposon gag protein [Gossypium australe]